MRFTAMKIGCVLILAAAAALAAGCSESSSTAALAAHSTGAQADRVAVQLAPVTRRNLSSTIEVVGSFVPHRRTVLVSEVDAVIRSIPTRLLEVAGQKFDLPLDIGAAVKKGELLVELDDTEYQLDLKAAQANLLRAERDLADLTEPTRPEEIRRLKAAVLQAEAQRDFARAEVQRAERLIATQAVSKTELERLRTAAREAEAAVEQAQATLEEAEKGPTDAEIAVKQAAVAQAQAQVDRAQWKLDRCRIVAPYDAVITDRFVDQGDRVTAMPRVEIMELMDIHILSAQVSVPERYLGAIEIGDVAEVWPETMSEPVPGAVGRINHKVDPLTRTFRIRVGVMNLDGKLRAGQFVRVRLPVQRVEGVLAIPRSALLFAGGIPHVFVYDGNHVQRRNVRLGIESEDTVEIVEGLKEGQLVVVHDPSILTDGMEVDVAEELPGESQGEESP